MNKNPLLIKSFMSAQIPFLKDKTSSLYSKYLSENKFIKTGTSELKEVVSAYSLFSTHTPDLIFDQVDTTVREDFSEKEWIALGMLLRAYKEVEGINLLHLYNCIYKRENRAARGYIVSGREYSLYCDTQLGVKLIIYGPNASKVSETRKYSLSRRFPFCFKAPEAGLEPGTLLSLEIVFEGESQPATLVEGLYQDLTMSGLQNHKKIGLVPEALLPGEYSSKLVEFFSGTLITKLSDTKLIKYLSEELPGNSASFEERVNEASLGIFNKDGLLDRRLKL